MNKTTTLSNNMTIPSIGFGTCKHDLTQTIDDIILDAINGALRSTSITLQSPLSWG